MPVIIFTRTRYGTFLRRDDLGRNPIDRSLPERIWNFERDEKQREIGKTPLSAFTMHLLCGPMPGYESGTNCGRVSGGEVIKRIESKTTGSTDHNAISFLSRPRIAFHCSAPLRPSRVHGPEDLLRFVLPLSA